MATQGSKVRTVDYNTLYTNLNNVLGTGSGKTGYGQTLSASPSAVTTSDKIRGVHWSNMRLDILKAAGHQGLSENSSWTAGTLTSIPTLPTVTGGSTQKVSAATITAYQNAITVVSDTSNIYKLIAGQYSDELGTSSTRSTNWKVAINHNWTIDFGSADNARYFFNAGGVINITPTFTQNVYDTINNDWYALINGVGTIEFNYLNTTVSGTQKSSIGFYGLTSTAQQIYIKNGGLVSGGSMYATNDVRLTVSCDILNNSTGGARYVYFQMYFEDNKSYIDPLWPQGDEPVQGTVTNTVRMFRPSGTNVNAPVPTYTNTVLLTAGS